MSEQKVITQTRKSQITAFFKKLGLLFFSSIFILVLLEFGVRFFTKSVYPILRTDAEVGTIHQKNFKGFIWNAEAGRNVYVITNNIGYIGEDFILEKPAGVIRVAVLGDSMTESLQVDYYDNFVNLLESALNASAACEGRRIEIMNYGVGGTGTFLQYQTYKKNIAPYAPDIVTVMFHNDYSDNLNKANFDLENYKEGRGRNTRLKSFLLKFQLPKFIFVKLQHSLVFLKFLNRLGLYEFNKYTEEAMTVGAESLEKKPEFYDHTFTILKKFNALVSARGAKFVVVVMPDENDYKKDSDAWQKNSRIIKLLDFLRENNISYFNPAPFMALAKKESGTCLTYKCGGHLNNFGHEVFAQALYKFFKTDLLFSSSGYRMGCI